MGQIIKSIPLHIQAYNIVRDFILDGKLKPAERIIETRLAKSLGISRGPIREAIRMLIQDGLLVYDDSFIKVYQPTVKDIIDIFQCRENLESLAISLAMENLTDDTVNALSDSIEKTRAKLDQPVKLKQFDQEFHTIINESSNNPQLIELLEMIKIKIYYMRNSMVDASFYPSIADEHQKILDVMLSKDTKKAQIIMKEHIQKGLEAVLNNLD